MRWWKSDGRTPRAKEGKPRRRLGSTAGGEGLARLHSGRDGRPGGLL